MSAALLMLVVALLVLTVWLYWPERDEGPERDDRDRLSVADIEARLAAEEDERP